MPSLTQREQDLLHRYRRFYLDLVEGRRLPETDAQRRFLDFSHFAVSARVVSIGAPTIIIIWSLGNRSGSQLWWGTMPDMFEDNSL